MRWIGELSSRVRWRWSFVDAGAAVRVEVEMTADGKYAFRKRYPMPNDGLSLSSRARRHRGDHDEQPPRSKNKSDRPASARRRREAGAWRGPHWLGIERSKGRLARLRRFKALQHHHRPRSSVVHLRARENLAGNRVQSGGHARDQTHSKPSGRRQTLLRRVAPNSELLPTPEHYCRWRTASGGPVVRSDQGAGRPIQRLLTWPDPSTLASDDAVMAKLWRDSAMIVALPATELSASNTRGCTTPII
jgi:hypothetical protein